MARIKERMEALDYIRSYLGYLAPNEPRDDRRLMAVLILDATGFSHGDRPSKQDQKAIKGLIRRLYRSGHLSRSVMGSERSRLGTRLQDIEASEENKPWIFTGPLFDPEQAMRTDCPPWEYGAEDHERIAQEEENEVSPTWFTEGFILRHIER